jgi:hypothetical protein
MSQDLQAEVSILEEATGIREQSLRRAWRVRKTGRYGYITLEQEGENSYFAFYLLIRGVWNRLEFRRYEGANDIVQTSGFGTVTEVAMEEDTRSRLLLMVEDRDGDRLWMINWIPYGAPILLVAVVTAVEPYFIVI